MKRAQTQPSAQLSVRLQRSFWDSPSNAIKSALIKTGPALITCCWCTEAAAAHQVGPLFGIDWSNSISLSDMYVNYDQSIHSLTASFEGANPYSILGVVNAVHRNMSQSPRHSSSLAVVSVSFWWLNQHPLHAVTFYWAASSSLMSNTNVLLQRQHRPLVNGHLELKTQEAVDTNLWPSHLRQQSPNVYLNWTFSNTAISVKLFSIPKNICRQITLISTAVEWSKREKPLKVKTKTDWLTECSQYTTERQ